MYNDDDKTHMFFIPEKVKETISFFLQETAKVL